MMLALYRAITFAGAPLIRLYLARRLGRGKEDAERFAERLGRPARPRPEGMLAWVHAASVGEALSVLPLVARLGAGRPDLGVLLTTGTVTSARLLDGRLPDGAFHQYVPVDRRPYVRRFLDHWRPDVVLWAESEFWPNLVSEPASRGVPMVLVNGRMSARSFAGWRFSPGLIRGLLGGFRLCLAQTAADAERLERLGARDAKAVGNLKFAAPPLPADQRELERLGALVGGRPLWLAASTHPGEEAIAGRVHRLLAPAFPGLLTVVVPRHPERGAAVARALGEAGLAVARRAAGQDPGPGTDVYVADTLGELGLFYRLSVVVFVGKSLAARGGQNPLEPARLDCAVVFGPHMANFEDIAGRMAEAGAALGVPDEAALAAAVERLLSDPGERARLAGAAGAFAAAEGDVVERVMAELAPYLGPAPAPREGPARARA